RVVGVVAAAARLDGLGGGSLVRRLRDIREGDIVAAQPDGEHIRAVDHVGIEEGEVGLDRSEGAGDRAGVEDLVGEGWVDRSGRAQVEPAAKGCRPADAEAGCAGADTRYQRAAGSKRKIA